jgi:hypothetical protein
LPPSPPQERFRSTVQANPEAPLLHALVAILPGAQDAVLEDDNLLMLLLSACTPMLQLAPRALEAYHEEVEKLKLEVEALPIPPTSSQLHCSLQDLLHSCLRVPSALLANVQQRDRDDTRKFVK